MDEAVNTVAPVAAIAAAAKPKAKPVIKAKAVAKPVAVKPAPVAKEPKAAKPVTRKYEFATAYTGPSDAITRNQSKTAINYKAFNTLAAAALSDRDEKAIAAFRQQFGAKDFERGNIDAGIIRRLLERGAMAHVSGGATDPKAMLRLTPKGLGKQEPKAKAA